MKFTTLSATDVPAARFMSSQKANIAFVGALGEGKLILLGLLDVVVSNVMYPLSLAM